jgi:hypothetical protein
MSAVFDHGASVHAIDNEPAIHLERGGAACGGGNPAEALRYELGWASTATSKAESGHCQPPSMLLLGCAETSSKLSRKDAGGGPGCFSAKSQPGRCS